MKFVITRNYLDKALNVISRGVATNSPTPAFTGIYIKAEENLLTFISNNKEIAIQLSLEAGNDLNIVEPGDCVVPGKLFSDIIKKIDDGRLEFSIFDEKTAKIISKNSDFTIATYEKFAFPNINFNIQGPTMEFSCKELRKIVAQTSFACATNETRFSLMGLRFLINEKGFTITGSDGYKLAQKTCSVINLELGSANLPLQALIPAKSIDEYCHIIPDSQDKVYITINNNVVLFTYNNIKFTTRLIEGNYPDTSKVFSYAKTLEVKFNRQELIQAVDRASIFISNFQMNFVKLYFNANSTDVILASNSTETGRVEVNLSPISIDPPTDLMVAFSSKSFMDSLKSIEGDVVSIQFSDAIKPAILKNANEDSLLIALFLPRSN